eukprot:365180-Chlamydomonas_euryale.AAC.5
MLRGTTSTLRPSCGRAWATHGACGPTNVWGVVVRWAVGSHSPRTDRRRSGAAALRRTAGPQPAPIPSGMSNRRQMNQWPMTCCVGGSAERLHGWHATARDAQRGPCNTTHGHQSCKAAGQADAGARSLHLSPTPTLWFKPSQ